MVGWRIVMASWVAVGATTVVAAAAAAGLAAAHGATTALSLGLFLASLAVWVYAFGRAIVRSTHGDDIGVANLFFLVGSAPPTQRRHLMGSLAASVVVAVVAMFSNPYVVLVPMLPLGLAGAWAARHGTFPPRPARPAARGGRR